jgi:hypothetical protein
MRLYVKLGHNFDSGGTAVTQLPETLYNRDFYLWTQRTAKLLAEGKFSDLDIVNLVEEIESMGRNEKRELKNCLIVLLMHLLKWKYQPGKRSESWRSTISDRRIYLELLLEDSPSLKPFLPEVFDKCYQKARLKAASETGIRQDIFPVQSPFTLEETLSFEYLPEATD